MKMRRWAFACLLGGLFLFSSLCWAEEGAENVILRDCDYCHDEIALDLSKRGGAHRDEIGCRGCHPGHPLKGREPYADCSECHDPGDSDHFTLPACLSCHNPHHPRDVDFSKAQDAEKVCITCHENPVVVTSGIANPHAGQECNECHQAHRTLPQCVSCHEPHNRKMVQADCVGCHPAHNPKAVKFNIAVPSSYCASCHESIVKAVNTAGAAHKEIGNCNECHKHHPPETGGIPYCSECHGPGEQAHFGLKRCTGCHDPHAPVVVDLLPLKKVRAACVTCHPEPGRQLKEQPSSHTKMDCNKCHQKHAEALECLTCHQGHNPSMTHKDCLGCHAPHAPIPQAIATDVPADQCAACHEAAVASFTGAGGAHKEALETCGGCHEKHGESPDCLSCHEGHTAEMIFADCVKCHNPHQPTVPKLAEGTPAQLCAACHDGLVKTFAADGAAHKEEMGCVGCHQSHPPEEAIPACADCHDAGDSAHYALSNCSECHNPHAPLKIDFAAIKGVQRACVTCHSAIVQDLSENGGRHKTEIGCQDCHQQHPKKGEGVKVECAWCHAPDDRPHFAIDNCLTCHNPHHPKDVDLAGKGELKEVCLSCHQGVVQVDEGISNAHAEFACNECHQSHGDAPDCTECHEPHGDSMTVKDCQSCHAPHNPRAMKELAQAPTALCGACHEGPVQAFANGGAHIEVGCSGCHEAHGAIPVCADCHDADERAHFGLDDCASCHNPHAPLVEELADLDNVRPACVSCHDEQGKQTDQHPSPHAEMGCNECHLKHGEAQQCLECHEPHTPSMTYQDCLSCHAPHMPTQVDFAQRPDSRQCAGCHSAPVAEINELGSAHKSKIGCTDCHNTHPGVGCTDCHATHPDQGLAAKISCARCHAPNTRAHFALKDCKACHSPHKPLDVDLSAIDPVKPACISCHLPIGSDFMAAPSAHNEMDCNECHQSHGEYFECLECHEPHSAQMTYADCLGCHNPHKPTALSYPEKITPALCGACHNEQVQQIADKGMAHQTAVGCGSCHPQHKPEENTILSCRTCHPRLKKLHYTADPCTPCHNPHTPREIDFSARDAVKPVCVTCHSVVGRFMEFNPSKHSAVDCSECHKSHGEAMECLECHSPHTGEMQYADCLGCHSPHKPTDIVLPVDINTVFCSACHGEQVSLIEAKGGAHQSEINCVSCHLEHPPKGEKTIPECSMCHEAGDNSHFGVQGCSSCHNPHAPFELDFSAVKEAKPACLSCHQDQQQAMDAAPSAHAEVDCSRCHPSHGEKKSCDSCHAPHSEEMTADDCLACHPAHTPTRISLGDQLSPGFCAACHEGISGSLAASQAKHRELSCLECHQGDHGAIMSCDSCHGQPHEAGLHSKFPDCLKCHKDPHSLVNWSTQ